jgi:hypothetical protein
MAATAILLAFGVAPAAFAQVTVDEVAAGLENGVYVEPGAEGVEVGRLESIRADAADEDLDLSVVVLASSVDAVAFAEAVKDRVGGTVLVFTPDTYGVSSSELSQGRLDDALDDADADLAGDDIAAGVSAFVDAAIPTSRPWGLIITGALLLLVVVAVAGRAIERRATADRRAAALARRWGELKERADDVADPVLELSTRVEIDGRPDIAARYRDAATRYGDLTRELGRAPKARRVDDLNRALTEVEAELEALHTEVAPAD